MWPLLYRHFSGLQGRVPRNNAAAKSPRPRRTLFGQISAFVHVLSEAIPPP
jgi:hypothetical protein